VLMFLCVFIAWRPERAAVIEENTVLNGTVQESLKRARLAS